MYRQATPFNLYRKCIDCDRKFLVINDTDWLCDPCSNRLVTHNRISVKDNISRNWEDKQIRESWKRSYNESNQNLLNKCIGVNYHNEV